MGTLYDKQMVIKTHLHLHKTSPFHIRKVEMFQCVHYSTTSTVGVGTVLILVCVVYFYLYVPDKMWIYNMISGGFYWFGVLIIWFWFVLRENVTPSSNNSYIKQVRSIKGPAILRGRFGGLDVIGLENQYFWSNGGCNGNGMPGHVAYFSRVGDTFSFGRGKAFLWLDRGWRDMVKYKAKGHSKKGTPKAYFWQLPLVRLKQIWIKSKWTFKSVITKPLHDKPNGWHYPVEPSSFMVRSVNHYIFWRTFTCQTKWMTSFSSIEGEH